MHSYLIKLNSIKIPLWIASILPGVILGLSFSPYHLLPFGLLSIIHLQCSLFKTVSIKRASLHGFLFSMGYHCICWYWMAVPIVYDAEQPMILGALAVFGASMLASLCFASACGLHRFARFSGILGIISFASCIMFSEVLIGYVFRFPWSLIGYIWHPSEIMLQSTSLFGIYGLTWITLLTCSIIGGSFIYYTGMRRCICAFSSVILIATIYIYGYHRLHHKITSSFNYKIRIIQPNLSNHVKSYSHDMYVRMNRYIDLSLQGDIHDIDLIIWPETAINMPLDHSNIQSLRSFFNVLPKNTSVATGIMRINETTYQNYFNSFAIINYKSEMLAYYDKHILAPFGEFIPFKKYLSFLDPITQIDNELMPSTSEHKTIKVGSMPRVLPLICYESIFTDYIINATHLEHPKWLVVITNDKWFGLSSGAYQHALISRVRAIEAGIPMIVSANSGISYITDSYGTILNSSRINTSEIIDSNLSMNYLKNKYSPKILFIINTLSFMILPIFVLLRIILNCIS